MSVALKKILIVEDEKPLAKALGFKVQNHGFEMMAVYNGRQALEALEKDKFDLVLLDLVMPDVGGFEVLEKMRERGDYTPVVILSNLNDDASIKKAKELGAREYFVKSSTPILSVIEKMQELLG